ncbi:MAG: dinitrogenase iron-molybdenum cofactor biosynthesis protein, partial [Geobacteraceae bacterium]|nr:dinitrogenase iron-molybdenum cofactor biosynthesis protein [Geobacteraceae bacterium]
MLIAVASKDGKEINQHFGHAERFLIYDVENGEAKLVEERTVERYCSFDPEHPLRG